jgi:DNA helicase HerA-like ATPase
LPTKGKPVSIIDLSRFPSEATRVVVAILSRLIFDFAIWSRGGPSKPILIVCEEAHRYLPSGLNINDAATKSFERISKEGRKYGVSLGLITQRPSDLAEGALSQCGTMIAMRLTNERDQAYVRSIMPEAGRHFVGLIQALRNRECLICGEGVSMPVRVRIDGLKEDLLPSSHDPLFSQLWKKRGDEEEVINRSILRWLNQSL